MQFHLNFNLKLSTKNIFFYLILYLAIFYNLYNKLNRYNNIQHGHNRYEFNYDINFNKFSNFIRA